MTTHQCNMSPACKSITCHHAHPHSPGHPHNCDRPAPCGNWPGRPDFKPRVVCIPVDQVQRAEDVFKNRTTDPVEINNHGRMAAENEALREAVEQWQGFFTSACNSLSISSEAGFKTRSERDKYRAEAQELREELERLRDYKSDVDEWAQVLERTVLEVTEERDQLKVSLNSILDALDGVRKAPRRAGHQLNHPDPKAERDAWRKLNSACDQAISGSTAAYDAEVVRAARDAARDACDGHGTDSAMEHDAALCRHIDQLLEEANEVEEPSNEPN